MGNDILGLPSGHEAKQRDLPNFSGAVVHPAHFGRISAARIQPYPRKHLSFFCWLCCTAWDTVWSLGLRGQVAASTAFRHAKEEKPIGPHDG